MSAINMPHKFITGLSVSEEGVYGENIEYLAQFKLLSFLKKMQWSVLTNDSKRI